MTTSPRFRWGVCVAAALGLSLAAVAAGADEADDAELRTKVEQRLERAEFVEHHDIRVRVDDGLVALEGTVEAEHAKQEAEEIARSVDGVKDVDNRLLVGVGAGGPDAIPPIDAGAPLPTGPQVPTP